MIRFIIRSIMSIRFLMVLMIAVILNALVTETAPMIASFLEVQEWAFTQAYMFTVMLAWGWNADSIFDYFKVFKVHGPH